MSISDNLEKGKSAPSGLKRAVDMLFVPLLIILVGTIAYGLGRFQDIQAEKEPIEIRKPGPRVEGELQGAGAGTALGVPQPAPSSTTTETTPVQAGQYVGSKTGSAYYLPWCGGARRIKEENKVWFPSKEAAEKAGYKPAKNCKGI